jgi:hypothetical protein
MESEPGMKVIDDELASSLEDDGSSELEGRISEC